MIAVTMVKGIRALERNSLYRPGLPAMWQVCRQVQARWAS